MITNKYVNRGIDYILNHIGEDISVEDVAKYCGYSKYYFSRIFKISTGESIYEFIKRVKMEQSAFKLKVEKNKSVTYVSSDYGYSSSNYSSAFKQHHNMSPIEFRRNIFQKSLNNPIFNTTYSKLETFEVCNKKILIQNIPNYNVIYERHIGNYENLSVHWGEFQKKYSQYITQNALLIERTFDDPSITSLDECLYELCITVPKECIFENTYTLKGGKFAVYHFEGKIYEIYFAYQSIFNIWLPSSNHSIDERYGFHIYRKIDCNALYMEIDICIPIK